MTQSAHTFVSQITRTVSLAYLLSLPRGYDASGPKRWPLILFLHGSGERGNDLQLLRKHGIPRIVEEQEDFPFIALSPQCPRDCWWSDHIEALGQLIDEVISRHPIDTSRVYLTGLSMGGYGAWHLAMTYPQRFAALVPICGGGVCFTPLADRLGALKDVPTWVFHGAQDTIVPLHESELMVEMLRTRGGNVRLTVYPDAPHDSWTRTYSDPRLYDWLLSQSRPTR
jgi:predicted peptidase